MKKLNLFWIIPLILILTLFLIRLSSPKEIDDLHPNINCEKEYLEKSDTLWVIPKFENYSISNNKTWCKEILSLNKTLGLHGYEHTYEEYGENQITENQINESLEIFKDCFGFYPPMFKPPQLSLNSENRKLLEEHNLIIKQWFNQGIHKVYHCDQIGNLPNWFQDLF